MSGTTLNIVTGVLALIAAGLFGWAWSAYQRGQRSLAWPSAPGVITASGVRESTSQDSSGTSSTTYYPQVAYDYHAGGQNLSGSSIKVGNTSEQSRMAADAVAGRYPVGSKVEVYFDPAKPTDAVLVRGVNSMVVLSIAGGGVALLVGATVVNSIFRH